MTAGGWLAVALFLAVDLVILLLALADARDARRRLALLHRWACLGRGNLPESLRPPAVPRPPSAWAPPPWVETGIPTIVIPAPTRFPIPGNGHAEDGPPPEDTP